MTRTVDVNSEDEGFTLIELMVVVLIIAILAPGPVAAHAHLIRADLAPDSHVLVRAGPYRFWFDEALNPALSRIVLQDGQGRRRLAAAQVAGRGPPQTFALLGGRRRHSRRRLVLPGRLPEQAVRHLLF